MVEEATGRRASAGGAVPRCSVRVGKVYVCRAARKGTGAARQHGRRRGRFAVKVAAPRTPGPMKTTRNYSTVVVRAEPRYAVIRR